MPNEKESTTKLKIDATEFKRGIADANRAIKLANSEFKAATSSMDNWADSTEGQQAKIKQLNAVMEAEQKKLSILQEQYKKVVAAQGENSTEAENLKIRMNNQQASIGKVEKELKNYTEKLNNADTSTKDLTVSEQKAEEQTEQLSGEFSSAKVALGNFISDGLEKGIGKLVELADAAKQAYQELDEGADNVIKATGATGNAAESLTNSYETVAKSVKGEFSTLGNIVGEINTRFGFTGNKLEKASVIFQKFADITGVDGKTAVQLVSKAMEKAGIESERYEKVLDKLAYASQATGVDVSKLAQSLSDNGAAFKALGLDIDSQISLLASFERGGVNVSSALGGLKKAVGNWAKEGKNANTEFAKTMQMIQSAPNDTEAATIAVEAFGAKSGVELAEAMRTGKFSYEDFAQSLKKSNKTVENTYESTQDGLDKINLAMQGVKVDVAKAFSELLEENKETIDEGINYFKSNLIPKAKTVIKWTIDNFGTITTIAKGAATAMAAIWAINKASAFVMSFESVVKLMSEYGVTTTAAAKAQKNLNTELSASPIGWLLKGTALFATGISTLFDLMADEIDVVDENIDRYKALHEQIEKNAEDWKTVKDARNDSMASADKEFDYLEKLKGELDLITDANGRVKRGYEDRAKYITDRLSEATGIEIENNGKVIKSYDDISASIDKILQKKRAQAIMSANEDAYQQAFMNNEQYYLDFVKAKEAYDEADKNISKYEYQLRDLNNQIVSAVTVKNNALEGKLREQYRNVEKLLENERVQKSTNYTAYEKAKNLYESTASVVQNYENLSAAITSGDEKAMNIAMNNMKNDFKRAETATYDTLKKQRDKYKEHYELLQKQIDKGTPGITQSMVEQAKEMCDASIKEVEKYEKEYAYAGYMNAGAYAGGLSSSESKQAVLLGVGNITTWTQQELKNAEGNMDEEGKYWMSRFSTGLNVGGTLYGIPAVLKVSDEVDKQLRASAAKSDSAGQLWSQKFLEGLHKGLSYFKTKTLQDILDEKTSGLMTELFKKNMQSMYSGNVNNSAGSVIVNNQNTQVNQTFNSPKSLTSYESQRLYNNSQLLNGNS